MKQSRKEIGDDSGSDEKGSCTSESASESSDPDLRITDEMTEDMKRMLRKK